MAGYSGTPLLKKLGIKDGHNVLLMSAPHGIENLVGDLPPGVTLRRGMRSTGPFDVILVFATSQRDFKPQFDAARARMAPACGLWCCWPKRSSGVTTDLTEDVIRDLALAAGLVDNKVCAIDDTWSGLRIVIRTKDRRVKDRT